MLVHRAGLCLAGQRIGQDRRDAIEAALRFAQSLGQLHTLFGEMGHELGAIRDNNAVIAEALGIARDTSSRMIGKGRWAGAVTAEMDTALAARPLDAAALFFWCDEQFPD